MKIKPYLSLGFVLAAVGAIMIAGSVWANQKQTQDKSYNHLFEILNIEGWTVYINKKDLAEHPEEMTIALEHFQWQLYQIRLNTPPAAVTIMQEKIPLWFEYDTIDIAYHRRGWLIENGYKPPAVEINAGFCRAKTFLNVALHQPWVVLHELAHGYDFLYLRLKEGQANDLIKNVYDKAIESGKYDNVLCRHASRTKAYGLNNPAEFWAENSEAYLGINDFYPFVRAELKDHDPDTYAALEKLWGIDSRSLLLREKALVALMDENPSPMGWAREDIRIASNEKPPVYAQSYKPTSSYDCIHLEGWKVYVASDLGERKAYCDKVLKMLQYKLYMVRRYVPEKKLPTLQKAI